MIRPNEHLTQEALDDLLMGFPSRESEVHLTVCSECRAKVETFESALRGFNQATLAWSRSQVDAQPPLAPLASRSRKVRSPWTALAPAEWAMAIAVLFFLALPVWDRGHRAGPSAMLNPVSEDSEAQIAEDNNLLESVNEAVNARELSPLAEYAIDDRPHAQAAPAHSKTRPKSRDR